MRRSATETVGEGFRADLLRAARDKALAVIEAVAPQIRPGMVEGDVNALLTKAKRALGAEKDWHPPQIRFGANTLLSFGKKGEKDVPLKQHDIFFLDIGPLFDGHEGDVGRAFVVGDDPDMRRCVADVGAIWQEVRAHWNQGEVSGDELYRFAERCAASRGWQLTLEGANGHRVADFPHTVRRRGTIEGFDGRPAADRWILEIQIRHPTRPLGAFYEDLLN